MGIDRSGILENFLTLPTAGQRNATIAKYPLFLKLEPYTWILTVVATVLYVGYTLTALLDDSPVSIFMIVAEGGLSLALCFGLICWVFTFMSVISESVPFLSFLKFDDGNHKAFLVFPIS